MNFKGSVLTVLILLAVNSKINSQSVNTPNFGLKSHETLEISKIEISRERTLVYLTIENRIENGSFCADKNIYLIDPSGARTKLLKASGIPVCPESHRFKSAGERLNFTLAFPPLKSGSLCVDLIEECTENCFSFYGIILDKNLNNNLDEAFSLAAGGQSLKATERFVSLAETYQNTNGITPLLYFNIVKLASETGNKVKAGEWYKKLNSSGLAGSRIYIEQLNLQGIKY